MSHGIRGTIAIMALGAILYGSETAHAETYSYGFSGPGVSGLVNLTYGTAGDATYPQALKVTGISGTMTDTNNGLSIVNAAITGLVPLAVATPEVTNLLAPADFSKFYIASGSAFGDYSYDNLFWPNGSVQTASDYSAHGGFLDIYGLLFTIDGGYSVNFWSNGDSGSGVDYGLGVSLGVSPTAVQYDYLSGGVSAPVPEIDPSSFGSAFALLIGSLGLVERRARRVLGLTTVA